MSNTYYVNVFNHCVYISFELHELFVNAISVFTFIQRSLDVCRIDTNIKLIEKY